MRTPTVLETRCFFASFASNVSTTQIRVVPRTLPAGRTRHFSVFVHMGPSNTFEGAPLHDPPFGQCTAPNAPCTYRGTSLTRKRPPLGLYHHKALGTGLLYDPEE